MTAGGEKESVNFAVAFKTQECVETQTHHLEILGKDKYDVCQRYFSVCSPCLLPHRWVNTEVT